VGVGESNGTFGGLMNRYHSFDVVFACVGRVGTRYVRAVLERTTITHPEI